MKFSFKGNRKYIHGTDIFIFLEKIIDGKLKLLDLKILKKITKEPLISIKRSYNIKYKIDNSLKALCKINDKKNKYVFFSESKKKIKKSYSFNEKKLIKNFIIKKNSASCIIETSLHSIEILVALTKYWHQKQVKSGNWLFVRLKLYKIFKKTKKKFIKIININNINNNYTISEIFDNKEKIGKIYFVLNDKY